MSELVRGLVSVLLPTCDSADFVEQTVASVLRQNGVDWECVVSDDVSTDATLDIVRRVAGDDPRIRIVLRERRSGAAANWNAALAESRGEFVKLLCADDVLYDGALADQARLLEQHPGVTLVCGRRDVVDAHGRRLIADRGLRSRDVTSGEDALRMFVRTGTNVFGEPSFVLFRGSALRDVGGFAADSHYLIDVTTYAAVLHQGDLAVADRTVGAFRVHAGSWSAALHRGQALETRACVAAVASQLGVRPSGRERALGMARATANAWARRAVYGAAGFRDRHLPPGGAGW